MPLRGTSDKVDPELQTTTLVNVSTTPDQFAHATSSTAARSAVPTSPAAGRRTSWACRHGYHRANALHRRRTTTAACARWRLPSLAASGPGPAIWATSRHSFSVVPQLQAKLGYNLTNNIRATIVTTPCTGPTLMPRNQIDVIGTGLLGDTTRLRYEQLSDICAGFSTGSEGGKRVFPSVVERRNAAAPA